MDKQEWKEKKVSLGSAIIISAVFAVVGGIIGANWDNLFGGFAPYLGFNSTRKHLERWVESCPIPLPPKMPMS